MGVVGWRKWIFRHIIGFHLAQHGIGAGIYSAMDRTGCIKTDFVK